MKMGDIVEALQYFFLDIIGVIVPGISLIVGFGVILRVENIVYPLIPSSYQGIVLILLGYAAGHFVTSLGNIIFVPIIGTLASFLRKIPIVRRIVPKSIKPNQELISEIKKRDAFLNFIELINKDSYYKPLIEKSEPKDVYYWRDIAMSIGKDEKNIVYKFMFVSLLTSGMGTVLMTISFAWAILSLLVGWNFVQLNILPFKLEIAIFMMAMSFPFFERSASFYGMSMRVPFPIATARLASEFSIESKMSVNNEKFRSGRIDTHIKPRMYLAGGFKSGWQDILISEIPFFDYYDPRSHKISEEKGYTLWDLEAIRNCDWVIGYLERGNPGGYALALEIGFAKALEKKIILVDEKSEGDSDARKYMGMVHASADIEFCTLQEAIAYLKTIDNLYPSL